jgi:hypothetical protein
MKLYNEEFSNYPAFHANFEDVYIYKHGGFYFVFRESQEQYTNDYIMYGTKEEINGWLYGCVQANNKFVTARKTILI